MNIETALKTAIEYEIRVRETYVEAMDEASDAIGKRVFGLMAEEENGHVKYLEYQLAHWTEKGELALSNIETALPAAEDIEKEVRKLQEKIAPQEHEKEIEMLEKAHAIEVETSNYYEKLVRELPEEGKVLFKRFLEIEKGHQKLVEAELDCVSGNGYWFDMIEFDVANRD